MWVHCSTYRVGHKREEEVLSLERGRDVSSSGHPAANDADEDWICLVLPGYLHVRPCVCAVVHG